MEIISYSLIKNKKYGFLVNMAENVNISHKNLSFVPVKFGEVNGDFPCGYNKLTSLEFCPEYVKFGFICDKNNIKDLVFFPKYIGGNIKFDKSFEKELNIKKHSKTITKNIKKQVIENLKKKLEKKLNNKFELKNKPVKMKL